MSMYDAEYVCLDYETTSLKFWRPEFRVISCSFGWREDGEYKFRYLEGEEEIGKVVRTLADTRQKIVIHNAGFEIPVTKWRFGCDLNWHADTMRLSQVYDNGGADYPDGEESLLDKAIRKKSPITGFKLVNCAKRILPPEYHNHKEPFHKWIRENIPECKKGKEGSFLHLLPPKMLQEYNDADTLVTMKLYDTITQEFAEKRYNWRPDHVLYIDISRRISDAKAEGIKVDREKLTNNREIILERFNKIAVEFRAKFENEILQVESVRKEKFLSKYKSEKGRLKAEATQAAKWAFNVGSNKQLAQLFVDTLKIVPQFFTKGGKKKGPGPAFGAQFLHQWGEGGTMLAARRKIQLVLKQMDALLQLSAEDGYWHVDLKITGTRTGRLAGGQV